MAEAATDVGRSRFVVVISNGDKENTGWILPGEVEEIRKIWKKYGIPRVPKKKIASPILNLIRT